MRTSQKVWSFQKDWHSGLSPKLYGYHKPRPEEVVPRIISWYLCHVSSGHQWLEQWRSVSKWFLVWRVRLVLDHYHFNITFSSTSRKQLLSIHKVWCPFNPRIQISLRLPLPRSKAQEHLTSSLQHLLHDPSIPNGFDPHQTVPPPLLPTRHHDLALDPESRLHHRAEAIRDRPRKQDSNL